MRAVRVNQKFDVAGGKAKTMSQKTLKGLRGTSELGDNQMWVPHYEQALPHYTKSVDVLSV